MYICICICIYIYIYIYIVSFIPQERGARAGACGESAERKRDSPREALGTGEAVRGLFIRGEDNLMLYYIMIYCIIYYYIIYYYIM